MHSYIANGFSKDTTFIGKVLLERLRLALVERLFVILEALIDRLGDLFLVGRGAEAFGFFFVGHKADLDEDRWRGVLVNDIKGALFDGVHSLFRERDFPVVYDMPAQFIAFDRVHGFFHVVQNRCHIPFGFFLFEDLALVFVMGEL